MTTQEVPGLPSPTEALQQAQALLDKEKDNQFTVDPFSLVPNPLQGLWIVGFSSPTGESLDGGGICVDEDGARYLTSAPSAIEYVGALFPEVDEDPADEPEIEALLDDFDEGTRSEFAAVVQQFGPPGEDFSETVCIMAVPSGADPVHGIGPEDKHATLLYFGKMSESADPDRIKGSRGLFEDVLKVAAEGQGPFTAKVTGVEELGDEGAQVWMLDSPELQRLFGEIPEIDSEIQSMYDDAEATRYPEYKPHVTIGYDVDDDAMGNALAVKEIAFDRLSLWWGDEHVDIPLGVSEFDALLQQFGD
jgi:hypothetical protein